ncbi:MAG: hypothetical protein IT379_23840, partial [Deltaproteobacteria bacterium]|nr:hypothetical protein [Deltaproteobacteria bacterium]
SFARVAEGGQLDWEWLNDTQTCQGCHQDAAAHWRSSVHAFSSFNNPYYRAAVDRFRQDVGHEASRFCGACHDPVLLFSGGMDAEIAPDDPRAHQGVTCLVCHSIREVGPNGNGDYTITRAPVPMPVRGDPASVERHRQRLTLGPLRTAELCGSCHRAFLADHTGNPFHLVGQEELGHWRSSAHAGSISNLLDEEVPIRDCRGCHMELEPAPEGDLARDREGRIASHRATASHTTMAAMRGDPAQLERVSAQLRRAVTIDVAAARSADGRWFLPAETAVVVAGESLTFDVVVRNVGAGHRFPAGTRDAQDTWIELVVHDAAGRLLAEAGTQHERGPADDAEAHRFRAVQIDDQGRPALERDVHRFRGLAYDSTIAPRDATVVRYALRLPDDLAASALPLRVVARLRHRKHMREMQRTACAASTSERGRAFAATTRSLDLPVLDGCLEQPVTDIATATVYLGAASTRGTSSGAPSSGAPEGGAARATWRRLFDHSLGLMSSLQERLDEARPSLEAGLADAERTGDARARAMLLALRARLESRQGRVDEAIAWTDRAERLAPGHPALARLRGQTYASVWRWREAADALERAAIASPVDEGAWRELAIARGSHGDDAEALRAAWVGLHLAPRDEALLLNQSLALERLDRPGADRAREAYLDCRRPDDLPRLRNLCNRTVPGCARERVPVHVHELRAAAR